MEILRRISNFGASWNDLKTIYILYVRSLLEQSCTLWNNGLTEENVKDLERIQKTLCKLILQDSYKSYEHALKVLDLENLEDGRELPCIDFAKLV